MNTIRAYAADDAHVIYGTAYDESLGDQMRVTVIATGLSRQARAAGADQLCTVLAHRHRQPAVQRADARRQPAHGMAQQRPAARLRRHDGAERLAHQPHQAAAKVDALSRSGMDEFEIPAFLRKQAD